MNNVEQDARERVARFLPSAISQALSSYKKFSQKFETEDVRKFTDMHKACKVAVGHIELLVKLARQINSPNPDKDDPHDHSALAAMVEEAEAELRGYRAEHL